MLKLGKDDSGIPGREAICQEPLVVSFYTENTAYQLEVMHLIESCRKFGIDAEIVGVPSEGSWERNCAMKPFFIQKMLKERQRPVFWVDADAVFRRAPDFTLFLRADVALREMKRFFADRRFRLFAGSLFFNYTPRALRFVDAWCAYCQEKLDREEDVVFLDQTSLLDLMEQSAEVRVQALPVGYAKVFDIDALELAPEEVVVEHFQASRRYRFLNLEG